MNASNDEEKKKIIFVFLLFGGFYLTSAIIEAATQMAKKYSFYYPEYASHAKIDYVFFFSFRAVNTQAAKL